MMMVVVIKKSENGDDGEGDEEGDEDGDSCANHSRDHNRLPVPRSKQALSRRLQAWHLQKKLVRRLDSLVRVSRRVERDQKKIRVHVSWSSQAVLKMAAFGAHARQASADEPNGARLFSGFWVDGARSESAAASRSRPFRSRPKPHSFAASADGTRLEHHDTAA